MGVLATLGLYRLAVRAEAASLRAEFERRSQIIASVIGTSLRAHEDVLYSLRNLFNFSDDVSRAEFNGAAADLLAQHEGIHSLEWIPRVPGPERSRMEAAMRAEGFTHFEFRQRVQGNIFERAADRPEHYPVIYIHPYEGNQAALGFDLASSSIFGEFLQAARDNTLLTSGRVRLITDGKNSDWGYLLELPVYELPVPASPEARLPRLRGFVLGIFRIDEIIEGSIRHLSPQGVDVLAVDPAATPENRVLHFHPSRLSRTPAAAPPGAFFPPSPYARVISLSLPGRTWELHCRATPEWLATQRSHQPLIILVAGFLSSVLLGFYLRATLRRTELVESEVSVRTEELRHTQHLLEEDIHHRTRAEQALRASEANLQAVLDHSPNAIFVKDLAGRYMLVNRQYEIMWNRAAAVILGRTDDEVFPVADATRHRATDRQALEAGAAIRFDVTIQPEGRPRSTHVLVNKAPLRDAQGRVYGVCGILTDITDHKRAEVELQENRRQLSSLISQLPGAAFRCLFDEKLTALFASEGMLALTGHPPGDFVEGRVHIAQLTLPADRPAVRAAVAGAIRERRPFEVEYRLTHRDGQVKWVLVRGRPVYDEAGTLRFLEGLAIDVTAIKQAEAEKISIERKLLEAQKLESLGVLAGGIAHDFNNILTSVLANASLARQEAPAASPTAHSLEHIEQAARRAADLCQQMLAYAGKGKIVTDRVDLSELVRGTAALLEVTLSKSTRLELRLADGLPPVLADLTQLRQIVMNLVINAADAIGPKPSLSTVSTFAREADETLLRSALGHPELPPGIYAGLEVVDTGSGMTPETIARIFEPFFTTKFSGRGLGLSAVLGIVQSHRGALFVESQPGHGSTFRLLLPATAGAATLTAAPAAAPVATRPILRGTVLVIDDEDAIRRIATAVLKAHGATVLTATNGMEGIDLLQAQGPKVTLVLLDMTMPGLSGDETLHRIRQNGSDHPVILMSGYSEADAMQRSASLGVADFIQKPFEIATLVTKVKPFLP